MRVKYDLERSPIHLLHRAGQVVEAIFQKNVGGRLTSRQFIVLTAIASHPGASQMVLTAATGIDRSTLSDMIRRLKREGLVQRRRSNEDARAYIVDLSSNGAELLRFAGPRVAHAEEKMLARLPAGRRRDLAEELRAIIALGDQA